MIKKVILCFISLVFAQTANAASFDCAKAGSKVEKMICANPELSKLDEKLNRVYSEALIKVSDPENLKQRQRGWLKSRKVCIGVACLRNTYKAQIDVLKLKIARSGQPSSYVPLKEIPKTPAGYIMKQGFGYSICEAFKEKLDSLGKLMEPLSLSESRRVLWDIPGIKEAEWKNLNIEEHLELFKLLIRYDMLPSGQKARIKSYANGFGGSPLSEDEIEGNKKKAEKRITAWREEAKIGKAKLQVLRADMGLFDDKPETIARIIRNYGPGEHDNSYVIYLVTDDRKGIDLAKLGRASWANGDMVQYKGGHYMVDWGYGGGLLVKRDFGNGHVAFCTIEFDYKTWSQK